MGSVVYFRFLYEESVIVFKRCGGSVNVLYVGQGRCIGHAHGSYWMFNKCY